MYCRTLTEIMYAELIRCNLPFNYSSYNKPWCFLPPVLTVYSYRFCWDESSVSCFHSCCCLDHSIAQHRIIRGDYYSRLAWMMVEIKGFVVTGLKSAWENFVSGSVSLHEDCFRSLSVNSIQIAQFQTASLAEERVKFTCTWGFCYTFWLWLWECFCEKWC